VIVNDKKRTSPTNYLTSTRKQKGGLGDEALDDTTDQATKIS